MMSSCYTVVKKSQPSDNLQAGGERDDDLLRDGQIELLQDEDVHPGEPDHKILHDREVVVVPE